MMDIVRGRDDHSGSTDSALSAAVLVKRLLDFVKRSVSREPFNRRDAFVLHLTNRYHAGESQNSIEQNGAGATLSFATAFFGSSQSEIFAQDIEKPLHWRDGYSEVFTVGDERDLHRWPCHNDRAPNFPSWNRRGGRDGKEWPGW